ncbi:hypothetical protein HK096_010810, partial [Nowakowskiella sp. JEL0078]
MGFPANRSDWSVNVPAGRYKLKWQGSLTNNASFDLSVESQTFTIYPSTQSKAAAVGTGAVWTAVVVVGLLQMLWGCCRCTTTTTLPRTQTRTPRTATRRTTRRSTWCRCANAWRTSSMALQWESGQCVCRLQPCLFSVQVAAVRRLPQLALLCHLHRVHALRTGQEGQHRRPRPSARLAAEPRHLGVVRAAGAVDPASGLVGQSAQGDGQSVYAHHAARDWCRLVRCVGSGRSRYPKQLFKGRQLYLSVSFQSVEIIFLDYACSCTEVEIVPYYDVFYTMTVSSLIGLQTGIIVDNTVSRLVTLGVMIVGVVFLPSQFAILFSLMNNQSQYDRSYKNITNTDNKRHVIVSGVIEHWLVREFLKEFFSDDHGTETMSSQVVLLSPNEPNELMQLILQDPLYLNRVQYIKGTPTSFKSLRKARAQFAKAFFILSDRLGGRDPMEDDANSVMIALTVKKFNKDIKLHVQLIKLCVSTNSKWNTVSPGFSSLAYLLMTTIPEDSFTSLEKTLTSKIAPEQWALDYVEGAMMEVYETELSTTFQGITFRELCIRWYQATGTLIFALGIDESEGDDTKTLNSTEEEDKITIVYNPYEYILQGNEIAFVVARTPKKAKHIETGKGVNLKSDLPPLFPTNLASELINLLPPVLKLNGDQVNEVKASGSLLLNIKTTVNPVDKDDEFKPPSRFPADEVRNESKGDPAVVSALFAGSGHPEVVLGPGPLDASTDLPEVDDHILLCDFANAFPQNLVYFVAPIRHKVNKPIVILSPSKPTRLEWERLSAFYNVYHVCGSPLHRHSLVKARVGTASAVVILSNAKTNNENTDADASTILSLLNIETIITID